MLVATFYMIVALTLNQAGRADHSEKDHVGLRQNVSSALEMLGNRESFDVYYSTFEVLAVSELGDQLKPFSAPSSACSVSVDAIVERLHIAAKATKRTTAQQVDEIRKSAVPKHAEKSGLLVGGGPMHFQVVQGEHLFMQSCLSNRAYYSIVRTPEFGRYRVSCG